MFAVIRTYYTQFLAGNYMKLGCVHFRSRTYLHTRFRRTLPEIKGGVKTKVELRAPHGCRSGPIFAVERHARFRGQTT